MWLADWPSHGVLNVPWERTGQSGKDNGQKYQSDHIRNKRLSVPSEPQCKPRVLICTSSLHFQLCSPQPDVPCPSRSRRHSIIHQGPNDERIISSDTPTSSRTLTPPPTDQAVCPRPLTASSPPRAPTSVFYWPGTTTH